MDDTTKGGGAGGPDIEPIDPSAWPERRHRGTSPEGLDDDDWRRLRGDALPALGGEPLDWDAAGSVNGVAASVARDARAAAGAARTAASTVEPSHAVLVAPDPVVADGAVPSAAPSTRRVLAVTAGGALVVLALGMLVRGGDDGDASVDRPGVPGPVATTTVAPSGSTPATTRAVPSSATSAAPTATTPVVTATTSTAATLVAAPTTVTVFTVPSTTAPPSTVATPPRPAALAPGIDLADLGDHPWWGEVEGGVVHLRGRIATREAADDAVATARASAGDAPVVDELVVDPAAGPGTGPVPLFLVESVGFEPGSATVPDGDARLVGFARFTLFVQPSARLVVVGRSDGSEPVDLAGRRADEVAAGVAGAVVERSRIATVARPAPAGAPSTSDDRRVSFVFLGTLGG